MRDGTGSTSGVIVQNHKVSAGHRLSSARPLRSLPFPTLRQRLQTRAKSYQ
jgi:hypothetical protein